MKTEWPEPNHFMVQIRESDADTWRTTMKDSSESGKLRSHMLQKILLRKYQVRLVEAFHAKILGSWTEQLVKIHEYHEKR